jgi:hypothetical protein
LKKEEDKMIIKKDRPSGLTIGNLNDLNVGDILEIRGVNQDLRRKQIEKDRRSLQRTVNYYSREQDTKGKYAVSVLRNGEWYVSIERVK